MTEPEQFTVRNCGGAIAHNGERQEVMPRNANRLGGYISNNSDHVLPVFMGEAVELQPYRAVSLGSYQGPVYVTGQYTDRFAAAEFVKP